MCKSSLIARATLNTKIISLPLGQSAIMNVFYFDFIVYKLRQFEHKPWLGNCLRMYVIGSIKCNTHWYLRLVSTRPFPRIACVPNLRPRNPGSLRLHVHHCKRRPLYWCSHLRHYLGASVCRCDSSMLVYPVQCSQAAQLILGNDKIRFDRGYVSGLL